MDEERLIVEIEKYPEPFDPQSRHYKDNVKKDIAWRAIAQEIGFSVTDCKAKWKSLRDSYVKWRRKQPLPSGSGAGSLRDWKYAQLMAFLTPYMPNRSTTGNLEGYESGQDQEEEEEGTQQQQEDIAPPPLTASTPRARKASSRFRSRSPNTMINDKLLDFIQTPPIEPAPPKSDSELFLLSLVSQMERLSARNKTRAKIGILQLLEDLETSQENAQSPSFPCTPRSYDQARPYMLVRQESVPSTPPFVPPCPASARQQQVEQEPHYQFL